MVLRAMRGVATLPREQMAEVLLRTVPLSVFQPSGCAFPDFGRLALDDYGHSIRFGEYEASSRSVLQAARELRAGGEVRRES